MVWDKKWLVDLNVEKNQLVVFDSSNKSGAVDVKMDVENEWVCSWGKINGLTFSSKLSWGSYIISIAKTAYKKIGALIRSVKFPSPEFVLYLNKSTIRLLRLCMEYCLGWCS